MTAVIANRDIIDGIEVRIQTPDYQKEEKEYLKMTLMRFGGFKEFTSMSWRRQSLPPLTRVGF